LKKDFPSVAIGLCVRNSEKTIRQTIRSVAKLDYPMDRLILIVVDGNSRDNTVDIIRSEIEESNFKTKIMSDDGRGLSFARQLIVDNCDALYVAWIDGDNVLPCNFLKTQVDYLHRNPKLGVCGVRIVPLGKSLVSRLQGYQWTIPASDWKKAGYSMGKIGMQGTICRVDAIRTVGGFDLSIDGAGEDVDLFIRIKVAGWEITLNPDTCIYHYMRDTWRGLWKESVWWGYGTSYVSDKHKSFFPSMKKRAGFAVLDCFKLTFKSLILTKDLGCILMPLHYGLRRMGFLMGHWYARRDKYSVKRQT
jgi:cellulose synthase/poly-beta-1,6-N-acetylglucosamine synthase-like glycosyltransferase